MAGGEKHKGAFKSDSDESEADLEEENSLFEDPPDEDWGKDEDPEPTSYDVDDPEVNSSFEMEDEDELDF